MATIHDNGTMAENFLIDESEVYVMEPTSETAATTTGGGGGDRDTKEREEYFQEEQVVQ